MKNTLYLSILLTMLFISPKMMYAEDLFSYADIRSWSMGKTFTAICSSGNPSGYAFETKSTIAANYINRYGMKELSTYSCFGMYNNRILNTGIYISRFGMNAYNENKASIYFSRQLSEHIALGIRINYLFWQMYSMENNVHAITADIGMLIKPTEKLTIGMVINNPVRKGIIKGKSMDKLPVMIAAGISYEPLSTLLLTCEVEKSISEEVYYKAGAEYMPIKELAIRIGIIARPFIPTFGIGINLKAFSINLGAKYHNTLGLEYMCGINYSF